jgi:hypothetical protein
VVAAAAAAVANPQAHTCTSLNAEITLLSKARPLLINQALVSGKGMIAAVPAMFNAPPLLFVVSWPGRGPLRLKREARMGPFPKREVPRMLLIDFIAFIATMVMKRCMRCVLPTLTSSSSGPSFSDGIRKVPIGRPTDHNFRSGPNRPAGLYRKQVRTQGRIERGGCWDWLGPDWVWPF